jgi:hypothetical protein
MSITKIVLSFCFVIVAAGLSHGKEWRGIMPLHSTRADVERLLGPPADQNNELMSVYKLEKEVVIVQYAAGPPCGTDGFHIWRVPRDTVLSITVAPRTDLRFVDLKLDMDKYKVTDGGHVPNYTYYTDDKEGIQVEVTQDLVMSISYFPGAKDKELRCPGPAANLSYGKEWRGITPLHSKRLEVEHVLGKPSNTSHHWSIYQTGAETVSILYSNGLPCQTGANSEWRVPKGTVVSITVALKTIVLFSALTVDESKFQKRNDPHMLNAIEYLNMTAGESISVVNGEVKTFEYFGSSADSHLRCPNVRVPHVTTSAASSYRLDSYGNLRRKDEDIRLDNFAVALMQRPDARGYIFLYSAKDMAPSTARRRATRAKNYLVRVHRIKPARLVTHYGGRMSDFTVELYIVPQGATAPTPFAP